MFEKPRWSGKLPDDWKKGNIAFDFSKGKKTRAGKLQAGEPHLCAWEDPGADPLGSNVQAHTRQGGDLRQPAWLH